MLRAFLPFLLAASVVAAPIDRNEYLKLMRRGVDEIKSGEYEKAIATFKKLHELVPADPTAPYNIACALSLMGKKKEAVEYLKKSISLGFNDLKLLETDSDLENIRGEKGYKDALAELKKRIAEREAEARKKAEAEIREALRKKKPLFPFSFDLKDLEGKKLSLSALKGKVVLVDIWGTWCGPCRMEIPHLVELQKKYGKKGLVVVGLAFEGKAGEEAVRKVKQFAAKAGINYPLAVIDRAFLQRIPNFRGFPTLIFCDRAGKARFLHLGYSDSAKLAVWCEILLEHGKKKKSGAGKTKPRKEKARARKKWL